MTCIWVGELETGMTGGVVGKLGTTCATIFMPGCRMKSLLWEGLADGWTGAQRIYLGERQTLANCTFKSPTRCRLSWSHLLENHFTKCARIGQKPLPHSP